MTLAGVGGSGDREQKEWIQNRAKGTSQLTEVYRARANIKTDFFFETNLLNTIFILTEAWYLISYLYTPHGDSKL